jgi:hypothetical protein
MNFKDARRRLIADLIGGRYLHEPRDVAEGKNLLDSGDVTAEEVAVLAKSCRGNQHSKSPHHLIPEVDVHVFQPVSGPDVWYLKVYFLDDEDSGITMFISVHKSEYRRRR